MTDEIDGKEGIVAVVGDDWRADLGGAAKECGLWRVLGMSLGIYYRPFLLLLNNNILAALGTVKTGKYRAGDELKWQNSNGEVVEGDEKAHELIGPPDEVYESLEGFVDSLLDA